MFTSEIGVRVTVRGEHYWKDAPPHRYYLQSPHVHEFQITAYAPVSHTDRDIEFHDLQDGILGSLQQLYGRHFAGNFFLFEGRSCEAIGEDLLRLMPSVTTVIVSEDDSCWAEVHRE